MTENSQKPPVWYWIVSSLGLLWNLAGVYAFVQTIILENFASTQEQEIWSMTPMWAVIAFGVAVFGGTLGSLGLLLRKKWALNMFATSFAGVIVQNINSYAFTNSWEVFGPGGVAMVLTILVVAFLLITLARRAKGAGWTT